MSAAHRRRDGAHFVTSLGMTVAAVIAAGVVLSGCTVSPPAVAGLAAASPAAAAHRPTQAAEARRGFRPEDYGVRASPRVVAAGQPVPRGGGRTMVGRPYRIAGKTYTPAAQPRYAAVGLASWYGSDFHGRQTANGEVFDMHALSAAHPTMPLPSYARVTNLENGASVLVRVNDRGPYHRDRVIDVSARAASLLGMAQAGVAEVRVEYVGPARLDGRDERMLMASYEPPGRSGARAKPPSSMLAFNAEPAPAPAGRAVAERSVRVASLRQATAAEYNPFADGQADDIFADAPVLAPPPMHRSYAAEPQLTGAQQAAAMLALGELRLRPAAGADTELVQVGVFGERANAERIAVILAPYGRVTVEQITDDGMIRWSVRVLAAGGDRADAAVAAATGAGAKGAYRIAR